MPSDPTDGIRPLKASAKPLAVPSVRDNKRITIMQKKRETGIAVLSSHWKKK